MKKKKANSSKKSATQTESSPAPSAEEVRAEESNEPKLTELEKAQLEASEMKSRYLRSVADMENFRKRITREKQELLRSAAAGVIESLLPILDNMKLGLQAAEQHPDAKDVTVGFKMVDDQLKKSLEEHGLKELIPDGESFDPNLHECVAHQPSDTVDEDRIIETVRAGYQLNERLLRAANVIVSSGAASGVTDGND